VESLAATTNDVNIGTTISGLSLSTLYHARFVIVNSIGTVPGDDITFTTAASGGPGAGALVKGAKRICKVPKVTGKKINQARRKVIAAGCKVKVVYKHSKRPKNVVLLQSRKANKKLVYHALVRLTVSTHAKPKKHAAKKS
jgi:beta-lactam-binding protein with PASTA domain